MGSVVSGPASLFAQQVHAGAEVVLQEVCCLIELIDLIDRLLVLYAAPSEKEPNVSIVLLFNMRVVITPADTTPRHIYRHISIPIVTVKVMINELSAIV